MRYPSASILLLVTAGLAIGVTGVSIAAYARKVVPPTPPPTSSNGTARPTPPTEPGPVVKGPQPPDGPVPAVKDPPEPAPVVKAPPEPAPVAKDPPKPPPPNPQEVVKRAVGKLPAIRRTVVDRQDGTIRVRGIIALESLKCENCRANESITKTPPNVIRLVQEQTERADTLRNEAERVAREALKHDMPGSNFRVIVELPTALEVARDAIEAGGATVSGVRISHVWKDKDDQLVIEGTLEKNGQRPDAKELIIKALQDRGFLPPGDPDPVTKLWQPEK